MIGPPRGGGEGPAIDLNLKDAAQSGFKELGDLLARFLKDDLRGRLVVVGSAPRTGKSTLIGEWMRSTAAFEPSGSPPTEKRLLAVPVHASALIGGAGDLDRLTAKDDKTPAPAARLYRELIRALHFAVVREVTACLSRRPGGAEVAETLRMDLLRGELDLARIRGVWEEADALPDGVLMAPGAERGWAEVSAVWVLGRAFMLTSGLASAKRSSSREASWALSRTREVTVPWEKILTPALTLATGGVVGAQAFNGDAAATAALALAGALGGSWVAKREWKASGKSTNTAEFDEDLGLAALGRWMPSLLRQLKDVGLYPVFLVDEVRLTDWEGVKQELLDQLDVCRGIGNLGAFVCLLTDHASLRLLATRPEEERKRLRAAIADELFLGMHPRTFRELLRQANPSLTEDRVRAAILRGACLPLAVRADLGVSPPQPDPPWMIRYQQTVEVVVASLPYLERQPAERAFALDLLYEPVEVLKRGERILETDAEALGAWARQRSWIEDGPLPGGMLTARMRLLSLLAVDRPEGGALIAAEGPLYRWAVDYRGDPTMGQWFPTPEAWRSWEDDVRKAVRRAAGVALSAVLSGLPDDEPPTTGLLAESLHPQGGVVTHARDIQARLVGAALLAWLARGEGAPAAADVARALVWLGRLAREDQEHARERLYRLIPGAVDHRAPWALAAPAWSDGVERLLAWCAGPPEVAAEGRRKEREIVRSAAQEHFRARVRGGAGAPPESGAWPFVDPAWAVLGDLPEGTTRLSEWSSGLFSKAEPRTNRGAAWVALGFEDIAKRVDPEGPFLGALPTGSSGDRPLRVLLLRSDQRGEEERQFHRWELGGPDAATLVAVAPTPDKWRSTLAPAFDVLAWELDVEDPASTFAECRAAAQAAGRRVVLMPRDWALSADALALGTQVTFLTEQATAEETFAALPRLLSPPGSPASPG